MNHQQKSDSMHQFHPICIRQACKATKSNVTEFSFSSRQKESSWFIQAVRVCWQSRRSCTSRLAGSVITKLTDSSCLSPTQRKWMRETNRENETNRETQSEREVKMVWCRPGLWDRPLGHTTFLLLFERNKYILTSNQFLGASVFYLIQFHSFILQGGSAFAWVCTHRCAFRKVHRWNLWVISNHFLLTFAVSQHIYLWTSQCRSLICILILLVHAALLSTH